MENHCPCIVQKAVQRIHVLRCYRKCIIHLQIFSIFLSFSLVFLFPQKVFPSEYVNLLRQEVTFVNVFIRHKHKEHLLAEKDTVAKQIKNVGRKQRCTQAHWDKAEAFWVLIQYFKYKNTHINFHAFSYILKKWYLGSAQRLLFVLDVGKWRKEAVLDHKGLQHKVKERKWEGHLTSQVCCPRVAAGQMDWLPLHSQMFSKWAETEHH